MCNLLAWLILGGLAGWLASVITGRNQRQGCLMNIIVGVIGAFIGGVIWNLLSRQEVTFSLSGFDISSIGGFLIAVLGAVILLVIVNLVTRRR